MKKSKSSPAQARRNAVIEQARQAALAKSADIDRAYEAHKAAIQASVQA